MIRAPRSGAQDRAGAVCEDQEDCAMRRTRLALSVLMLGTLSITGCSSHNTTLVDRDAGQVIYRLSEKQAFTVVIDAYAEILPTQSLDDITGARRGYEATCRWGLDTFSQKTLIFPAVGTDARGGEVRGYYFEVSGSGTSTPCRLKNKGLYNRLREALDATKTAVVVTNLREGRYETDGRAYRAGGRDAREFAASRPAAPKGPSTVADQLRELKNLRDQGLITDQEYEAKRRQILDRI
jgi:hypothetical protein